MFRELTNDWAPEYLCLAVPLHSESCWSVLLRTMRPRKPFLLSAPAIDAQCGRCFIGAIASSRASSRSTARLSQATSAVA